MAIGVSFSFMMVTIRGGMSKVASIRPSDESDRRSSTTPHLPPSSPVLNGNSPEESVLHPSMQSIAEFSVHLDTSLRLRIVTLLEDTIDKVGGLDLEIKG